MNFIDLFAGAGGLSEGFQRAGFNPIAHVELDKSACFTIKTRNAYRFLKENNRMEEYYSYLRGEMNRKEFYKILPADIGENVINAAIGKDNKKIFKQIDKLKGDQLVDLIVGGPPCQAYSIIGRAALKHKEEDERKKLYIHYGRFLSRYSPKIFVFENVPGLLTSDGGEHFKNLKKYFNRLGYNVASSELNAYDFGVVQTRRRIIIIGWQETMEFSYPSFQTLKHSYTSTDIFHDLPPLNPGDAERVQYYTTDTPGDYLNRTEIRNGVNFVTQHITRIHNKNDLAIYRMAIKQLEKDGKRLKNDEIPEDKRTQKNTVDFLDRFKVVDKIPHTMIAHIAKDGHHFIHPDINQLRSISVREAARIQSFPDDFYFEGEIEDKNRTAAFRQIGNAVPPLMSYQIASKLFTLLNV